MIYRRINVTFLIFCTFLVFVRAVTQTCACENYGICLQMAQHSNCFCMPNFIGDKCQHAATNLQENQTILAKISNEYSFFYIEPPEENYYRFRFNICMEKNPLNIQDLIYMEIQRNDGSIKASPSLFEAVKLIISYQHCVEFSTQFINVKRPQRFGLRKIIIGLKVFNRDFSGNNLKTLIGKPESKEDKEKQRNTKIINITSSSNQKADPYAQTVRISVEYQSYFLPGTSKTIFLAFMAFFSFILILLYFYNRFKRSASLPLIAQPLDFDEDFDDLEALEHLRSRKHHLNHFMAFMPVKRYREMNSFSKLFVPLERLQKQEKNKESCSICLVQFEEGDEVRTTPCKHKYHRQCIDNWCENVLNCPMCRRSLDFQVVLKNLYIDYLCRQLEQIDSN